MKMPAWNKSSRGFGPADLFGTMILLLLYAYMFVPVVSPALVSAVAGYNPSSQFYGAEVALTWLLNVMVLIVILLAIYNRAFPQYSAQNGG
jgi:hypothetical protein